MKYIVTMNGNRFEVEVERVSPFHQLTREEIASGAAAAPAAPVAAPAAPAPAPAPSPAPKPAPAPAPAPKPAAPAPAGGAQIVCPMPGTVLAVKAGQTVFVVEAMLAGIIVCFVMDKTGTGSEEMYAHLDSIGDICLAIFVSMAITTMKLWQLIDLALPLITILLLQVVLIFVFVRFLTFPLCGKDYDAAIIAVGHTGFGLGAVPVSMATMSSVCEEYRYSKLAYFVVPLIGGFISNLTYAIAITTFMNIAAGML